MASLPHQIIIPFASIRSSAYTITNKNTTFATPSIAKLLLHNNNINNKKKMMHYFGKPIKLSSSPIIMSKWKAMCINDNHDDRTSGGVAPEPDEEEEDNLSPQHSLVLQFYKAFNNNEIQKLEQLLSPQHCSYDDILFYGPFEDTQSVLKLLERAKDALGPNIHIHLEHIEQHNQYSITVFLQLEWRSNMIPYTKGCRIFEFEEVEGKVLIRKITGLEELPVKPGELVLNAIKTIRTFFDNYPLPLQAILHASNSSRDSPHEGTDNPFGNLFGRGH